MRSFLSVLVLAAGYTVQVRSTAVTGTAFGFAVGTTGGGNAAAVYPKDIAELKSLLADDVARNIIINKEYNYVGSEGTTTEEGCRPASNTCVNNGGQDAINGAGWCKGKPAVSVTYDTAGVTPLYIGSNKSLVGLNANGIIRGKGLRISNGASNVIIQNIHVTHLNPQYIWGGDAFAIDDADKVWIDHCQTSLIGRQHVVIGNGKGTHVTISNHYFDGRTSWSASCNGRHYWTAILSGLNAQVTFAGNWLRSTSGRSPKIDSTGTAVIHAVNNWFMDNTGHAFDIGNGGYVFAEGNVFEQVATPLTADSTGYLFADGASNPTACQAALGRDCQGNLLTDSGSFSGSHAGVIARIGSYAVTASSTRVVKYNVQKNAGIGNL